VLRFWCASIVVLTLSVLLRGETPEKITICKLKNDPAAYRHKLVQVEGFASHGFEDFTLFDPNCPYSPMIWLEYGGTVASGTIYCCGPSDARSRAKEMVVEGVSVPLVDDSLFRRFDKLLHDEADTVAHASVVGRFFPGEREPSANASGNWGGYGHFGCCSLLVIQQVISVDPHDREDLDYRASADQPDLDKLQCGTFQDIGPQLSDRLMFDIQHRAEAGEGSWILDDPKRVALSFLAQKLRIDQKTITGLDERKSRGRIVYDWHPAGKHETYMVVVSRPYWLSFYAADESKVAWVVIAAYESCG